MVTPNDQKILNLLTDEARKVTPKGGHVWLYGSRARGEANEDSDWDILILLDKPKVSTEDFNTVAYPLVELGWVLDANISPQIYSKEEWQKISFTPYYKNVVHDKIEMV